MTDGTNRPPEFSEQLETDPVHLSDQELLAQDYLIRRLWQFRGREEKVQWGGLSLEPEALLQRHDLLRQEMRKRSFLSVPSWEESDELEKIRAAFKSPGGKYHLFKKIIAVIPEHKTYVEAFCGGGQVYFHKASSEEEVINDIDPGIISSYRFIKAMTPEDLEWLKKQHWVISERQARNLFKMTPRTRRERFYRFLYLNKATYLGKGHIWTGIRRNGPNSEGNRIKIVDRLPEIQERLKRTKIHCWDWKEVIGQYDSPEAFFYLDPPYAIHWPKNETEGELEEKFFKEEEMIAQLRKMRGKFLLSYETEKAKLFKGFKIYRVKTLWTGARHEGHRVKYELLVSNFPLKPTDLYVDKSGGPFSGERDFDDVEFIEAL